MFKWIALVVGVSVGLLLVVRIIKVMLKTEKESKATEKQENAPQQEYVPENAPVDIHSASSSVSMPTSNFTPDFNTSNLDDDFDKFLNDDMSELDDLNFPQMTDTGFTDHADDEFFDYSKHMRNRRGIRRKAMDFDLDGEMADDDFEYIPSSPDFSYLHNHQPPKQKKTLEKSLNEMPTELKVLMLSDIFDRKF